MAKSISVGVVGCGYWGPNLIRNFRALPECSLKLMCDVDLDRLQHLKALYPEVEGHVDYTHLLNGAGLDAIVIATSVRHHYHMPKTTLLPANPTFLENPL